MAPENRQGPRVLRACQRFTTLAVAPFRPRSLNAATRIVPRAAIGPLTAGLCVVGSEAVGRVAECEARQLEIGRTGTLDQLQARRRNAVVENQAFRVQAR